MGMWAPHLPAEAGGMGIGFMPYVYMNEILGRSPFAPRAFGSQAPDSGNAEILWQFGTQEQKDTLHEAARQRRHPLLLLDDRARGLRRRPDGPPDPRRPRRRRVGDQRPQVVHQPAPSARRSPSSCASPTPTRPPHRRMSQIIVPTDTPGFNIVRPVPVMGETDGSHCEILYDDVRVPVTNTLGEAGDGFRIAQKRLGPGRIHHCMRWLGQMQRAFELMCNYSLDARGLRQHARREADGPELDRRLARRDPGRAPADAARRPQDRPGRRGARRDLRSSSSSARRSCTTSSTARSRCTARAASPATRRSSACTATPAPPASTTARTRVHRMVVARRILQEFSQGSQFEFE